MRSPLIAVVKQGKLHGVITAPRLLAMALKCGLINNGHFRAVSARRLRGLSA
jgi:hypothetical protein